MDIMTSTVIKWGDFFKKKFIQIFYGFMQTKESNGTK